MWDVGGVVLPVGVHGDDDSALGQVKAGGKSSALAKVAAETQDFQVGIIRLQATQHCDAVILAAVVYGQDFIP